jgi:uncharacterized protein
LLQPYGVPMPELTIRSPIDRLRDWFRPLPGTITAFSGGIDSSLVLYLSKMLLGANALGCISVSPSLKRKDYAGAIAFCDLYGIALEVVETREIEDADYAANPPDRCWHCKSHLYRDLRAVQVRHPGFLVLNGTNRDDLGDYRPGLRAAEAFQVRSPLVECGLTKADVRSLARHCGLPNHDKPASPCLSSRVPYGQPVTLDKLRQIEAAEEVLNRYGFADVRVRHHGEEARIEVPADSIARLWARFGTIAAEIEGLGFERCTLDWEGLVSGKLNRALGPQ